MKRLLVALLASLSLAGPVLAQQGAAELADGQVRRVDKSAGKITLQHGPIKNLDMPPMTMVFQAADPAFLDRVKAGDKVRFTVVEKSGTYIITSIEPAK